ncbi:hypothetical protein [Streptomyces lavendofoliae]|uniref:hypothetical protein n=1 Tax=Streptomyces lavendofoliae TaxID=67314 RepID=UPI003D8CB2D7
MVVRRTGASGGGVYLLSADEPVLRLVVTCGVSSMVAAPWRRVPLAIMGPVSDAVREWPTRSTGEPPPTDNIRADIRISFFVRVNIPERIDQLACRRRRRERPCAFDKAVYRRRNVVERRFHRLKQSRGAAVCWWARTKVESKHPRSTCIVAPIAGLQSGRRVRTGRLPW